MTFQVSVTNTYIISINTIVDHRKIVISYVTNYILFIRTLILNFSNIMSLTQIICMKLVGKYLKNNKLNSLCSFVALISFLSLVHSLIIAYSTLHSVVHVAR